MISMCVYHVPVTHKFDDFRLDLDFNTSSLFPSQCDANFSKEEEKKSDAGVFLSSGWSGYTTLVLLEDGGTGNIP